MPTAKQTSDAERNSLLAPFGEVRPRLSHPKTARGCALTRPKEPTVVSIRRPVRPAGPLARATALPANRHRYRPRGSHQLSGTRNGTQRRGGRPFLKHKEPLDELG